jgi:hypothetical protein
MTVDAERGMPPEKVERALVEARSGRLAGAEMLHVRLGQQ